MTDENGPPSFAEAAIPSDISCDGASFTAAQLPNLLDGARCVGRDALIDHLEQIIISKTWSSQVQYARPSLADPDRQYMVQYNMP